MKKLTKSEFVENFSKRFPNKNFDFSDSVYIDTKTPMDVICDKGHKFTIRPNDLMCGTGCDICGGTKKMTTEEFKEKGTFVHNGYFKYYNTFYEGSDKNVIVTCPIHGDIEVKANNHLNGANCKYCSREKITHKITKLPQVNKSTKKLNLEEFKQRLYNKWGDTYYVKEGEQYIKNDIQLKIICKIHGEFPITPNHILGGRGCPICGRNKPKTKEEIIEQIKEAHPLSDYDFSLIKYKNIHTPIKIKCNKCGTIFKNSAANIIYGKNGCPGCNQSYMENEIEYVLQQNNILYEKQKTFTWLKDKRYLRLDFYLPNSNIAIECQGMQHFTNVLFGKGCETLQKIRHRDNLKKQLCDNNSIKLIYYANYHFDFPYNIFTDKDEMINYIKIIENDTSKK